MIVSSRRSLPRWIGLLASVLVLGIVIGATGLSSGRVRNRIPGLANGPAPTATPAGLVISLAQLPEDETAAIPPVAAAAVPVVSVAPPADAVRATPADSPLASIGTVSPATLEARAATPPATSAPAMTNPATPAPTGIAPTAVVASKPVGAAVAQAPATAPPATNAPATLAPATSVSAPPTPTRAAPTATPQPAPTAVPTPAPLPNAVFLQPMSHWYQGWNQCAEMAASMALSYFGTKVDPNAVTAQLRPVNGPQGSKNVESYRIAAFLNTQGVQAQAFEGGSVGRVKQLVAAGVPVIVGQWQNRADHAGIGHWRVVRGYDDAKGIFILNDSMLDPAFQIAYAEFDDLWPLYDYVYIPVWNNRTAPAVQRIMGAEMDREVNIARAVAYAQSRAEQQPTNAEIQFGLGGAYFRAGNYERAAEQFHKAKDMGLLKKTPFALWYQSWPVVALGKVGFEDEALQLAQENIKSAGVYALMHYNRGQIFEGRGEMANAKREYQLALTDDKNLPEAQAALARFG